MNQTDERLTSVAELKAFLFLKMIEDMLEVLNSLEVYSMDSLGLIMETMADVTKDTEGLSINARVGALASVYCPTPHVGILASLLAH